MATQIVINSNQAATRDPNDLTFNQLLGINNEGTIAGYFGSGQVVAGTLHPNKGYTFTPDYDTNDFHNENFLGSVQTQVTGINNGGVTVGFWADANNNNFGFVDNNGVISDVNDPMGMGKAAGGATVEQLLGVNDNVNGAKNSAEAVGFWTDSNGNEHGFTYNLSSKSFTEVDISGFASTETTAINNEGHIAGFVSNNGGINDVSFIKEGSTIDWLTGPKGAVSVQALGINNHDQVVGSYETVANGPMSGFVYDLHSNTYATVVAQNDPKNAAEDPATTANSKLVPMTVLNGINDNGQVVGFYLDKTGNTDPLQVSFSVKNS